MDRMGRMCCPRCCRENWRTRPSTSSGRTGRRSPYPAPLDSCSPIGVEDMLHGNDDWGWLRCFGTGLWAGVFPLTPSAGSGQALTLSPRERELSFPPPVCTGAGSAPTGFLLSQEGRLRVAAVFRGCVSRQGRPAGRPYRFAGLGLVVGVVVGVVIGCFDGEAG